MKIPSQLELLLAVTMGLLLKGVGGDVLHLTTIHIVLCGISSKTLKRQLHCVNWKGKQM